MVLALSHSGIPIGKVTFITGRPPTARGFSTAKKRKPTKKQLAALAKGRRALAKKYK